MSGRPQAPFFLAALTLPLLVPPLVYGAVALGAGFGVSGTVEALAGQFAGGRPSLLGASILGVLPALLLLGVVRLLRRFDPGDAWRRAAGWGGLAAILLVLIWANLEAWPAFLPGRPFPGFPHGLELVIAPLFFAPVAMVLGGACAGLLAHRR